MRLQALNAEFDEQTMNLQNLKIRINRCQKQMASAKMLI